MTEIIVAIIVAGGTGERLAAHIPKQYLPLNNKAIISHTIEKFKSISQISHIIAVINPDHKQLFKEATKNLNDIEIVYGGNERWKSAKNGVIAAGKYQPTKILIHDANRPFVSSDTILKTIDALDHYSGAIAGMPVFDTIKQVENNIIRKTIDRSKLVAVQTPQGFKYNDLIDAYERDQELFITDDASILEEKKDLVIIPSASTNFKITTEEDYRRAMAMFTKEIRTGMGFDAHKFSEEQASGFIMLGGVKIEHPQNMLAHSDGDVLIHAVVDALFGAIGVGDIGLHFPPSDNKWKGADSSIFLLEAKRLIAEKNAKIINIDVTVICEKPRISPYREEIQIRLAHLLEIDANRINIKGTTTEKMGFTGRGEGIAVQSVANVEIVI